MENTNFINYANTEINNNNKLLTENYFEIQKTAEKIYGNNTVIFIEIGSFYEIYQNIEIGKAKEISKELNIFLTKKSKKNPEISNSNPYMCGIPSIMLEKHIEKLIENNKWTIIIINQTVEIDNNKQKVTRQIKDIISKGINIKYNKDYNYNFVSSIVIEKIKNIYCIGLSFIDVSIGEVYVTEIISEENDKKLALDEVQNYLNKYPSKEIIIKKSKNISDKDFEEIKKDLELEKINYIIINNKTSSIDLQNKILLEAFSIKSILTPVEELNLEKFILGTESLTNLLLFIIEHNPNIIKKLKIPNLLNNKKKLYCGNNAIKQLNIIEENNKSIEKIINKAQTAFGKRYIKNLLLNPITEEEEIKRRYEQSAKFIKLEEKTKVEIKNELFKIYDLERLNRLINLNELTTRDFFNFYKSIIYSNKIFEILENLNFNKINILKSIKKIIKEIEKKFDIEKIYQFSSQREDETFINMTEINSENKELFNYIKEKEKYTNKLKEIEKIFLNLFDITSSKTTDFNLKLKYTEKEGYFYEMTAAKYKELKKNKIKNQEELTKYKIKTLTNNIKITSEEINNLSNQIFILQNKIIKESLNIFKEYINSFSKNEKIIKDIIQNIKEIEMLIVNNYLSQNNYVKPEIIKTSGSEKFIDIKELRHPIVELEENNGIFIPNDIILGDIKYIKNQNKINEFKIKNKDKINGVMLHGLNASGKSTLIKSIGIGIILAQAGFFVPAKSFRFSLFDSLFTRISGADDIYKGLSTFTIEMLEMKNIFNRATKKTIILGDELSHGTETQSAISIVTSGFLTLQEMDTLFFFATHLHQLNEINEIKNNKNLIPLHLHVEHDKKNNKFIFDRHLKYGQGLSTYGLEYAEFLNLNEKFIKKAYEIRKQIVKNKSEIEELSKQKTSNYNNKLYLTNCIFCNSKATQTHHINEQKEANENKQINHFHKNHKYNLIPICDNHHKKIHHSNCSKNKDFKLMEWVSTSSGKKLWISPCLVEEMNIDIDSKSDLISY